MGHDSILDRMGYTFNIPHKMITYDAENEEIGHLEAVIEQYVLTYTGEKLKDSGTRVSYTEYENLLEGYGQSVENQTDVYVTLKVQIRPDFNESMVKINHFLSSNLDGLNIASIIKHRLEQTKAYRVVTTEECDTPIQDTNKRIPGIAILMSIGNELLCDINADEDRFISDLSDILYRAIVDPYFAQTITN